ncbi:KH domain-containing protein, partial [Anaerolineales bacterium HSG24]|nr:KH domain-containing protein [Anaerolineales bacterium HSG24]
ISVVSLSYWDKPRSLPHESPTQVGHGGCLNMSSMKHLVEFMAKAVVNDPDSVIVREIEGSSSTIYELSVTPDDMGRVIGKQGRVANAMRTLLRVAAVKEGKRVTLEIV